MATTSGNVPPGALTRRELTRIAAATKRVERSRVNGTHGANRGRYQAAPDPIRTVVLVTTVGARVGNTLGTGTARLCATNPETGQEVPIPDADALITVYNSYAFNFPATAGKRGKIHFEGGLPKMLDREC